MKISSILLLLTEKQRATLMYAHEHGISQFIELADKRFVGVDAEHISYCQIEESDGRWSTGTLRTATSENQPS